MDNQLTDALGSPHDIGGVDRLVRGDHHHALHAVLIAGLRHVERPEHVVLDRLARTEFHQGNMLVRSGVEDHIGPAHFKDMLDTRTVAHGTDQYLQI